jgi:DMSO/TMAO reductase YedYZ molybdopterin-dependent catalytic subunit
VVRTGVDRKAREAGVDEGRIPPGQYYTDKWPVLHAGGVPAIDPATWAVRVHGLVERELLVTLADLRSLGRREVTADIHCVTRWTMLGRRFAGVPAASLLAAAGPLPAARHVVAHAEQGYSSNLPLAALQEDGALLADEAEGVPLPPEHGGPLRLLVPSRYFWKSAKWLRALELRADDRPGFWERHGYHANADPWREERHGR